MVDVASLREVGFHIITKHNFPKPETIKFQYFKNKRQKRRNGTLHKTYDDTIKQNRFRINVSLTEQVIVPSENKRWGWYYNDKGEYFNIEYKVRKDEDIIKTFAHEIAHLTIFNHSKEHEELTEKLFKEITDTYNKYTTTGRFETDTENQYV